jgi:hypothetical protein
MTSSVRPHRRRTSRRASLVATRQPALVRALVVDRGRGTDSVGIVVAVIVSPP